MLLNILLISAAISSAFSSQQMFNVTIDTKSVLHTTSDSFLGVTIDAYVIRDHWKKFDLSNEKLIEATRALRPLYLRVGGSAADFLYFNTSLGNPTPLPPVLMSVSDWDKLNSFIQKIPDCEFYFGLNILIRNGNHWNPTNAIKLLEYTNRMGYNVNFELGNEPGEYFLHSNITLTAAQEIADFITLKKLVSRFPNLAKSKIAGPDADRQPKTIDYLKQFVQGAGSVIDIVTWHHYYTNGRTATVSTYMDSSLLDSFKSTIVTINSAMQGLWSTSKIWLGEAGPTYGGGTPGVSDRFVAGFMWLDKLGLSARFGHAAVLRQSLISGNIALLNDDYSPRPDFWLSWIFKKLVSKYVLRVSVWPESNKVRLYANCLLNRKGLSSTTVVLYGMNLLDKDVQVVLPSSLYDKGAYVYWLTPGDNDGLTSRFVKLNGEMLQTPKGEWPPLPTSKVFIPAGKPLTLQAKSFGFFTLLSTSNNACNTHRI